MTAPLPNDPKLAMAEVQRRRLECDHKDKYVRQLAPSGLRDRAEDQLTLDQEKEVLRSAREHMQKMGMAI